MKGEPYYFCIIERTTQDRPFITHIMCEETKQQMIGPKDLPKNTNIQYNGQSNKSVH